MRNNENMPKMKLSSNASVYVGSTTKKMLKKYRRALMEGIRHKVEYYNYQTGNSIGNIKFVSKVKDKNDEDKNGRNCCM